jgi:glutathione S-transferase
MLKLYGSGRSRWVKPYWLLRELDIPFEPVLVSAMRGETRTPTFLSMNPLAKVPVLEADGDAIFESTAICAYLADKHREKGLIPAPGTLDRARHDQWVSVAVTELEQPLWRIARHTFIYPPEKRSVDDIALACDDFRRVVRRVSATFAGETLLERFSVADITMAYTLRWASGVAQHGDLLAEAPEARAYLDRQCARPAFPEELYG